MIHLSPSTTVGLEFSDTTLRFIRLKKQRELFIPIDFAEIAIPQGCLRDGKIINRTAFIRFLSEVKKNHSIAFAYIALPTSATRIVSGLIDAVTGVSTASALRQLLETKTSFAMNDLISAKRLVLHTKKGRFMQLVTASAAVSQEFLECFTRAGIIPLSFEDHAQAQSVAVLGAGDIRPVMMVRIDEHATTLAIVIQGSVVDTVTLDEGSTTVLTRTPGQYSTSLASAINHYYIQWHTTKAYAGIFDTVKTVYITGAGAAIEGYADFISETLKLPVIEANTWKNCFSFEVMIPKLSRVESLRYVTAVGLALGTGAMSVLPHTHKKHLKRKKVLRKLLIVLLSFVAGLLAGVIVVIVLFVTKLLPVIEPYIHKIAGWATAL